MMPREPRSPFLLNLDAKLFPNTPILAYLGAVLPITGINAVWLIFEMVNLDPAREVC